MDPAQTPPSAALAAQHADAAGAGVDAVEAVDRPTTKAESDLSDHPTVRVVVVDDQQPFRAAAAMVVDLVDGFEVVGEADSAIDLYERLDDLAPDLVIMDVRMPGIDGIAATREVRARRPGCAVVVMSTYAADDYSTMATQAGAIGFVTKSDFGPEVLEWVRSQWGW